MDLPSSDAHPVWVAARCSTNVEELVKALDDAAGQNVDAMKDPEEYEETPAIAVAAMEGHPANVRSACCVCVCVCVCVWWPPLTACLCVCVCLRLQVAELLRRGASVSAPNATWGGTAAWWACRSNNVLSFAVCAAGGAKWSELTDVKVGVSPVFLFFCFCCRLCRALCRSLSLSVSLCPSVCLSVSFSAALSLCIPLSVSLFVSLYMFLFLSMSFSVPLCLCMAGLSLWLVSMESGLPYAR